ncbi:unnamed protein product [Ranitomeya imitator]|uniref:Protein Dr1 n=2 Tax=Ranitomeya imitator TaxID=111125 RepID=A0ABN9KSV3_9NEOB|nr:unnamed protein product [Ranitomeya imitator]
MELGDILGREEFTISLLAFRFYACNQGLVPVSSPVRPHVSSTPLTDMASSSGNDDDLTIPRAAINKMIKETLPSVRVANDARELVVNCCTEFIHLISSEANEICNKSEKKTISPEHVIQALESLGFGSYISEVKEVLQECKTVALKRRQANSRLENLGIPEEELLRQQQELFAKARQQQAELAQQEWLQMQQAAQQAQLAAASASATNQACSSQDEEDEDI